MFDIRHTASSRIRDGCRDSVDAFAYLICVREPFMRIAVLIAVGLILAPFQNEASAAWRRGRTGRTAEVAATRRPLMTPPTTILPRGKDIRAVPAAGGGRLIGYTLNLHPGGRAVRILIGR
jgi:hypothetical protein